MGKDVSLVEYTDKLMSVGLPTFLSNVVYMNYMLKKYGVKVYTGHKVECVTDNGVIITKVATGEQIVLPADDTVMAIGLAPNASCKNELLGKGFEVYEVGDGVEVGNIAASLADIPADEYVIATGAKPRALPIPGWDKTINAADYLLSGCEAGDRVAITGGGITGREVAYELALKGKHPFIVEVMDNLMKTPMVPAANSVLLRDLLKFHNVPVYLESKTTEIKDGSITVLTGGKSVDIPCDTVVVSVGYSAGTPLADAKKHPKNVHILCDADHVANLKNAIWSANDLVLKL